MKYFGEEKTIVIKPIIEKYSFINNPNKLYELLSKCWSKDTCAPRLSKDWNTNNISLGQCSITSFIVQDIFGGDVYGIKLDDGNYHCYNIVDGIVFDLTSAQFNNELEYKKENKQDRNIHFLNKEKYNRYKLLNKKLDSMLYFY